MTAPAVFANQNWKLLCVFLCHEIVVKSNKKWEAFVLVSLLRTVWFDVVTPISVHSMSENMFLLLLTRGILRDSFLLWDNLLPLVLRLHRFPFRHLHGALRQVQCLTSWGQIRVQSCRWTYWRIALPYSFPGCPELFTILAFVDFTSSLK